MDYYHVLNGLEDALCLAQAYTLAIMQLYQAAGRTIDQFFQQSRPSHLILGTLLSLYIFNSIILRNLIKFYRATSYGNLLYRIRGLPIIRAIVEAKLNGIAKNIRKDLSAVYKNEDFIFKLPQKPLSSETLLKKVRHYQMFDTSSWQQGRISGAIYTNNSSRFNEILLSVYGSNMWSNPLHSDVFAGVRKMESEIIRMVATMYRGDPDEMIGSVTSGGTESIIMACKAYRDYAIKVRKITGQPEIVVPTTAHAAFEKGASFLGCKFVRIPVDKRTFKVRLGDMRKAITANTCMLVGSAPQFPHGIIDPIVDIGKLGLQKGVPVHVDACLGGFLIPFMQQAGHPLDERFDFTVAGVTSISADTHKYGYAPKGTSVVIYSDKRFIHQQYSVHTEWPGGIYASPTLPGSRPGGLIATCWAAMMFHGIEGYVDATDRIIKTTQWIRAELRDVDGLDLLGDPKVSVLAFGSKLFNIYELHSRLSKLGWNLNALQFPPAFHMCVTLMHTNNNVAANFVKDVKSSVRQLVRDTKKGPAKSADSGSAAIYGMASTVADRSLVAQVCTSYLDACLGH